MNLGVKCMFIILFKFNIYSATDKKTNMILRSAEIIKSTEEEKFLLLYDMISILNNYDTKEKIVSHIYRSFNINGQKAETSKKQFFLNNYKIFYTTFKESLENFIRAHSKNIILSDSDSSTNPSNEVFKLFKRLKQNEEKEILDLFEKKDRKIILEKPIYNTFVFFTCKIILIKILDNLSREDLKEIIGVMSFENKKKAYKNDNANLMNIMENNDAKKFAEKKNFIIMKPDMNDLVVLQKFDKNIEWASQNKNSGLYEYKNIASDILKFKHKNFLEIFDINESRYHEFGSLYYQYLIDDKIPQYFVNFDLNQIFIHTIYEMHKIDSKSFNFNLFWNKLYEIYIISCEKYFDNFILNNIQNNINLHIYVNHIYSHNIIFYKLKTYLYMNNKFNFLEQLSENRCKVTFYNIIQLLNNNFIISFRKKVGKNYYIAISKDNYVNGIMLGFKCYQKNKKDIDSYIEGDNKKTYKNVKFNYMVMLEKSDFL